MDKPQFFEKALHDDIVAVGINAHMPALLKCPVYAKGPDPLLGSIPGDSVYDAVGTVIEPCAVRDDPVDRLDILSVNIEKGADDLFSLSTETAVSTIFP